jgi:hypothetical protein
VPCLMNLGLHVGTSYAHKPQRYQTRHPVRIKYKGNSGRRRSHEGTPGVRIAAHKPGWPEIAACNSTCPVGAELVSARFAPLPEPVVEPLVEVGRDVLQALEVGPLQGLGGHTRGKEASVTPMPGEERGEGGHDNRERAPQIT